MAYSLIWLCKTDAKIDGWVNVPVKGPHWLVRSNQLPTLRWWNLVERMGIDDSATKFNGMWRPTKLGYDFVNGMVAVPRKVYTYKGDVETFGTEHIFISQCFKQNFDYAEVMSDNFNFNNLED
jgi:hypothetical protein